jgi:CheY-like chemotaxis protein
MKTVLVVDDDPDVGLALRAKLEASRRYAVLVATDGREALRIIESKQPDLLLCDIDMPDMDGIALADAMAASESMKRIPVIYLSSLVTPADVQRGVSAGSRVMLSKQSSLQELLGRIDHALGVS